jgi:predicted nucleic acid-binding protein
MGVEQLAQAISPGTLLLLDSSILIAYFDGSEAISSLAVEIVDHFVRSGRNEALVSAVSAMEILVRPLRLASGVDRPIVDFLKSFPHVRVAPIDLDIALEAAAIRATHGFSPPDALIVGTGIELGSKYLVTNDETWLRRLAPVTSGIQVCYVSRYL